MIQYMFDGCPLHWRHNDHDGVSNHQPHGCLLNRLFKCRSKKTPKLRVTGICVRNSPGPVNSRTKGQLRGQCFHLMTSSWLRFYTTTMSCSSLPFLLQETQQCSMAPSPRRQPGGRCAIPHSVWIQIRNGRLHKPPKLHWRCYHFPLPVVHRSHQYLFGALCYIIYSHNVMCQGWFDSMILYLIFPYN